MRRRNIVVINYGNFLIDFFNRVRFFSLETNFER